MASDGTFVKGFRTSARYFVEDTYGDFNVTSTQAYAIGGKVKSVNWTVRQDLIKTNSVGDGRNYKLQMYGTYTANATINWEVSDLSFLRFGVGDIAKWDDDGTSQSSPYILVESELTGIDMPSSNTALKGTDISAYNTVRIRPFSMLLYDRENEDSGNAYSESVDLLHGCMMNDFTLSASIGTPLVSTTNLIVREISFRRNISNVSSLLPYAASTDLSSIDKANTFALSNEKSWELGDEQPPLMFFNGQLKVDGTQMALVQSFNLHVNNQFRVYRDITDRFISMPTTGMRVITFSANLLFKLPPMTDTTGEGTILDIIKGYMGYSTSTTVGDSDELRPALATDSSATSPQISTPASVERNIQLLFSGTDLSGHEKGAEINLYNLVPEGFGNAVQSDNGLIEIPITFSVRGYPYNSAGDGSFNGYDGVSYTSLSNFKNMFRFWLTGA